MSRTPASHAAHTARRRLLAATAPLLLAAGLGAAVLAPAPALAWGSSVTGSGQQATESRTPGEFGAIALSASADITVRQGPTAVSVSADDNLLPLLETVVESGREGPTLHVRWKRGTSVRSHGKVRVEISTPSLRSVAISGSGDLRLEPFKTPALAVSISGSGDARIDGLVTEELGVRISGSGDLVGKGSTNKLAVSIAGSGDVQLGDMRAGEVSVKIAGSGNAAVNAQQALAVSIAGSGDVVYSGDARVSSSVAGSGTVRKR